MVANSSLQRLEEKGIRKAEMVARENPKKCLSAFSEGDRMTSLASFLDPKDARDLTSGNLSVTLFDIAASLLDIKKQDLRYQTFRGELIEGKLAEQTAPAPVTPEVPDMSKKKLPENVLDFKIPFQTSDTPRPKF